MKILEGLIIHNEIPLTEAFIPTRILHREGQLREIERRLKPILKNRKGESIYIYGPSGTGKTVLIKWILESYFESNSAYVNCWRYRRSNEVLKEILLDLRIPFKPSESTSTLLERLEEGIKHSQTIVCLDEVDQLKEFDVLYWLSIPRIILVLISNKPPSFLFFLDQRIRSRLAITEIHFPKYRASELYDILKDRVKFSFIPGTLPDKLIRKLRKSPELAKLNEDQRLIHKILEERGEMFSGDLYREYCKQVKNPVTQRSFRNYMKKMVRLGLVEASGGKGRWRKYKLVV